jgi:DNA polymerase-3 subunit alpha
MGKKKPEEMAKQKATFVEGAKRNGVRRGQGRAIFDLLEYFAGYGFNKSHSRRVRAHHVPDGLLKAHFPVEFMAP